MEKLTAQERIFWIVRILLERHISGITNKELAKELGTTEATVCRDMAVFEKYQWVCRNASARWRLSPDFGSISGEIIRSYQKAKLALAKEEAEYISAM